MTGKIIATIRAAMPSTKPYSPNAQAVINSFRASSGEACSDCASKDSTNPNDHATCESTLTDLARKKKLIGPDESLMTRGELFLARFSPDVALRVKADDHRAFRAATSEMATRMASGEFVNKATLG